MAAKLRLLPRQSVGVTQAPVPVVPVAVELRVALAVVVPAEPGPVAVELQAVLVVVLRVVAVPAVVLAAQAPAVARPVVQAAVVPRVVVVPAEGLFPSEPWLRVLPAAWAVLPWSLPRLCLPSRWLCRRLRWPHPPSRWPCRRLRWLLLPCRLRYLLSRSLRPRWKWPHLLSRFTHRRSRWLDPRPRFPCRISTSRCPISAFRASVCPAVREFPVQSSAVPPVPRLAVHPLLSSLTRARRHPRRVRSPFRLRHLR